MGNLGVLAPAANALLFAVAHYWQPYNWPLIFAMVLVNAYVAWWKRNIYLAMLLHCSANTIGATLSLLAGGKLPEPLSERELEVLAFIAAGNSNAEIADKLFVSMSTVKTHVNNLYRKLDARSRTHALARAGELSLI